MLRPGGARLRVRLRDRGLREGGRRLLPAGAGDALTVLAALASMGVGAINVVVECLSTRVLDKTDVGSFENTGWDLVFNMLGATVAAVWLARSCAVTPGSKHEAKRAMVLP